MIGIFNDNFPPILDGVALTVKNYADWLNKKQQDVCVVTANAPHEKYDLPYPVHTYYSLPLIMRKPYRYGFPALDPKLQMKISQLPLEIIHAHCPFMTGHLGLRIARERHIPLVATFHSKYKQDFERTIPVDVIVNQMVHHVTNFYQKADEVWVPQASVEPVLREYGYKGHVEVVDNGNDFASPYLEVTSIRNKMRAQLGINDGETMLLFVGQHIWEKNIGFILDALACIPNLPYKMFTIGIGYAENAIRDKIKTLGLEHKITMVGNVQDRELLKAYYAAADLFLFPSLYDNAPLVVREAAAMHTPTIMLNGSTSAEIIKSGYNGFLTENDIHVYANTIRYLMEEPNWIAQVGNNASFTISRTWENVVDEVILRYKDIQLRYKQRYLS